MNYVLVIESRMRSLGFVAMKVQAPYQLFVCDLTPRTMLVVEGTLNREDFKFEYEFYKATYLPGFERASFEKIYLECASPRQMLNHVTTYIQYLDKN